LKSIAVCLAQSSVFACELFLLMGIEVASVMLAPAAGASGKEDSPQ
jgi:hypothetical protein